MTREKFDALIQELQEVSRKNPKLYLARVVGLVALAYAYLLLVLLGSLALCLAMLGLFFYVPFLAIFGVVAFGGIFLAVARGLWVKLGNAQRPARDSVSRRPNFLPCWMNSAPCSTAARFTKFSSWAT